MNSEKIKIWLKDNRNSLIIGVIIGLILGLIIGWGIWPVEWTDLAPYHLRQDLREDYLRMAVFTSTSIGDASIAQKAWDELEDKAEDTFAAIRNQPLFVSDAQLGAFAQVVTTPEDASQPEVEVVKPETEKEAKKEGKINWLVISLSCIGVLLAAGLALYFFVLRGKRPGDNQTELVDANLTPTKTKDGGVDPITPLATTSRESFEPSLETEETQPVAQFMTTYAFGDDLYDDSFSVDSPSGGFLGECGVGVSETVGVGEPKRVSAFEIWLFDKNDIQTVTKVIMSEYAHRDDRTRMRLESKGELVLAEPGKQILLETATLQLEARIIDMAYGEGAAPDVSFFERLTLELLVWPK